MNSFQGNIPDTCVNNLIVACTMEAVEGTNAVNSFLHLSLSDQQSLLAGVSIQLLDWTTGLDYWTDLLPLKITFIPCN